MHVPAPPKLVSQQRQANKAQTLEQRQQTRKIAAETFLAWGTLDPLYAAGVASARGKYVTVRAITQHDSSSEIQMLGMPDVRTSQLFEIMDIGSDVPKKHLSQDDIGSFCISLATSLNPVNGMKESMFAIVHYDTICSVIHPDGLRAIAKSQLELKASIRDKANGLQGS